MNTANQVPTVWNQLAEAMYLKDSLTAKVTLSEHASSSFARVQSSKGLPEIARPIVRREGFYSCLATKSHTLSSSNSSEGRRYRVVLILSVE